MQPLDDHHLRLPGNFSPSPSGPVGRARVTRLRSMRRSGIERPGCTRVGTHHPGMDRQDGRAEPIRRRIVSIRKALVGYSRFPVMRGRLTSSGRGFPGHHREGRRKRRPPTSGSSRCSPMTITTCARRSPILTRAGVLLTRRSSRSTPPACTSSSHECRAGWSFS